MCFACSDITANDGSTLDYAANVRLIVSNLDAATYARFSNRILPKKTFDVSLDETVKTLKELFGHNTSIFARRYAYLRTQRNDETIRDYTGLVNRHSDIRGRALRRMEDNPQTTLKKLGAEIQQFVDIRQDVKLLGNLSSSSLSGINAVNAKKNQSRDSLLPCSRRGGPHWANDCDFANTTCHDCKRVGHKNGLCKNFPKKKKPIPKQKRRSANNVVTVASTTAHVTPSANNKNINVHGHFSCKFNIDDTKEEETVMQGTPRHF
ncbi:hypothetical protein ANCCEY_13903 [Ancylostoma ceylanicum]|uniref:DUF7083 domain-containing protein n=1 Tax=Ancylostoma ceylanicum TaxID=53326 RepID=A0A0D6LH69_9BILA|nr:hypothetical protein ANCCEY_13903 [Ancylostoma ceylanicum]